MKMRVLSRKTKERERAQREGGERKRTKVRRNDNEDLTVSVSNVFINRPLDSLSAEMTTRMSATKTERVKREKIP